MKDQYSVAKHNSAKSGTLVGPAACEQPTELSGQELYVNERFETVASAFAILMDRVRDSTRGVQHITRQIFGPGSDELNLPSGPANGCRAYDAGMFGAVNNGLGMTDEMLTETSNLLHVLQEAVNNLNNRVNRR